MTTDSPGFDFVAARTAMIESQLRPQGITDPKVIAAMGAVPREDYVADGARALAYGDRGAPKRGGGTLSPPAALAAMIQALAPQPGERALVVSDGPEYAAAVLSAMGVTATTDDTGADLFDLILVDGAIDHVPHSLSARLAPAGRLAAALIEDGVTRLVIGRQAGGIFGLTAFGDAYVQRLAGFERPRAFVF